VRNLLMGNVISALLASIAVLLAAPAYSGQFIRFNSSGINENGRIYEISAGNPNIEVGVGIDNTGQASGNIIGRTRF